MPHLPIERVRTAGTLWSDKLGRITTRAAQLLILVAAVSIAVYGLIQLKLVVIPLLVAIILAAALSPVVGYLRRKGLRPGLATWVTFLGAVVVLGSIVTGLVFAVRSEWDELVAAAVGGWEELRTFIFAGPLPIDRNDFDQAVDAMASYITSSQFGSGALSGLSRAAEFVSGGLLVAVVLFYLLKDGDRIWAFFLKAFRGERLKKVQRSGQRSLVVLGQYVRGTAIVALADALAIGLALLVLRVPLALPLAVIVFLGGFVPMVGATVAGIFAALVALVANGPVVALIVVAVVVLVNQLDGDILQPIVMGRTLRLHALVILLALAAGVILGGLVGAVLAVPLTAVGWAVIKVWAEVPEPAPAPEEERAPAPRMEEELAPEEAPELPGTPAGGPGT